MENRLNIWKSILLPYVCINATQLVLCAADNFQHADWNRNNAQIGAYSAIFHFDYHIALLTHWILYVTAIMFMF